MPMIPQRRSSKAPKANAKPVAGLFSLGHGRSKSGFDRMSSHSDFEKSGSVDKVDDETDTATATTTLSTPPLPFLQPYVDRGVLYALLTQEALIVEIAALGEYNYSVSLSNKTIEFVPQKGSNKRSLRFGAHVVASIAPGPHSVMWGHAVPPADNVPATMMLERAEADGVTEMVEDEAVFDKRWSSPESLTQVVAPRIAYAAVGITGTGPYFSFPTSAAGARMVVILDDYNNHLAPVTLSSITSRIPPLLGTHWEVLGNHRAAIRGLVEIMGWKLSERGEKMVIDDGERQATLAFDELNRLIYIAARNNESLFY